MIRFVVSLVFLLGFSGCSVLVDQIRGPRGCEGYDVHGIAMAFCSDEVTPYKAFPMEADFILHRMEEVLDLLNLPPFIELAAEKHTVVMVNWFDENDPPQINGQNYVGLYRGHWDHENVVIELWLKDPREKVRFTALAHEFWHFYEHQVFDFDMTDLMESPDHFALQDLGDFVIAYANDFDEADVPGMAEGKMEIHGQNL